MSTLKNLLMPTLRNAKNFLTSTLKIFSKFLMPTLKMFLKSNQIFFNVEMSSFNEDVSSQSILDVDIKKNFLMST